MARSFAEDLLGPTGEVGAPSEGGAGTGTGGEGVEVSRTGGFFSWVDGATADGYRAPRSPADRLAAEPPSPGAPVTLLTGEYGARVLEPLVARMGRPEVRVLPVANTFFGGNIAVTGLLAGSDVAAVLAGEPAGQRYLLPDVCLSRGLFLDGSSPTDLPLPVEIVPADGASLRRALGMPMGGTTGGQDGPGAVGAAPHLDLAAPALGR
jgi:hypothetical protein